MSNESTISQDELNKLLSGHDFGQPAKKEAFDENAYKSETKSAAEIIRERVAKKLAEKKESEKKAAEEQEKQKKQKEVLSQDDIDSLLSAMTGKKDTEPAEKPMRVYDFRNPAKFSQWDKNAMQAILESFSMQATETLLSKRKTSCLMQFGWNDQLSNSEYFRTLNKHTFIYKATTPIGWLIVEVEPELGWALLKQSKGTSIEQIDLNILYDYYVSDFLREFFEAVSEKAEKADAEFLMSGMDVWKSDVTEGANIPKGAICMMNTLHTKIGTRDGYMNILLGTEFFDGLKKLGLKTEKAEKMTKLKTIRTNAAETTFSLEIGRYNLEKTDFQPGEILKLDKAVTETLNLVKDGELLYECDCIYTTGDLPTSVFGTRVCKVRESGKTLKYEKGSVAVELFTVEIPNEKVPEIKEGSTLESDMAYEDVDTLAKLVVDGRTVAKGEVVIIDDCFAVKIAG